MSSKTAGGLDKFSAHLTTLSHFERRSCGRMGGIRERKRKQKKKKKDSLALTSLWNFIFKLTFIENINPKGPENE